MSHVLGLVPAKGTVGTVVTQTLSKIQGHSQYVQYAVLVFEKMDGKLINVVVFYFSSSFKALDYVQFTTEMPHSNLALNITLPLLSLFL